MTIMFINTILLIVQEIHPAKHMAVIEIDMFGRGTPVEIDFSELEKL